MSIHQKVKNALKCLGVVALVATLAVARAAEYPIRSVRVVIPQGPGGGGDLIVRALAPVLQLKLKQPIVVENRPGGNEVIAADVVAKAAPDGYTLGLISSTFSINTLGIAKLPYDSQRDLVAVGSLARVPMALLVSAEVGASDLRTLVAISKQKPGQLNYVSLGPTTFQGIGTEWLKKVSGADLTAIAYGGKGTVQGIMSGEVQVALLGFGAAAPALQAGKAKAIAVTSKSRMADHPDVPAISETYPEYEVTPWYGIVAPARTPAPIIKLINEALVEALSAPGMPQTLSRLGAEAMKMTPDEFERFLQEDAAKWKKVVNLIAR